MENIELSNRPQNVAQAHTVTCGKREKEIVDDDDDD